MKIAVVTRYFPSSAEPWQGRSAYQTLRLLARDADVRVFFPNAAYPSLLKPRSRIYDRLDASLSPPDVKVSYYDYTALPLVSRPFNGWMAARVLAASRSQLCARSHLQHLSLPRRICRAQDWQSALRSRRRHEHWVRSQ